MKIVLDGSELLARPWHVQTDSGVTLASFQTEEMAYNYINPRPRTMAAPTPTLDQTIASVAREIVRLRFATTAGIMPPALS